MKKVDAFFLFWFVWKKTAKSDEKSGCIFSLLIRVKKNGKVRWKKVDAFSSFDSCEKNGVIRWKNWMHFSSFDSCEKNGVIRWKTMLCVDTLFFPVISPGTATIDPASCDRPVPRAVSQFAQVCVTLRLRPIIIFTITKSMPVLINNKIISPPPPPPSLRHRNGPFYINLYLTVGRATAHACMRLKSPDMAGFTLVKKSRPIRGTLIDWTCTTTVKKRQSGQQTWAVYSPRIPAWSQDRSSFGSPSIPRCRWRTFSALLPLQTL